MALIPLQIFHSSQQGICVLPNSEILILHPLLGTHSQARDMEIDVKHMLNIPEAPSSGDFLSFSFVLSNNAIIHHTSYSLIGFYQIDYLSYTNNIL